MRARARTRRNEAVSPTREKETTMAKGKDRPSKEPKKPKKEKPKATRRRARRRSGAQGRQGLSFRPDARLA